MTTVLAFSPYACWRLHSNYEVAILSACREGGATVRAVLCDGQFSECDLHSGAGSQAPRPFTLCGGCQADARSVFEGAGLP
ncbi:MAG TPA: hypothetical protein VFW33_10035, partial [Gemmataceae bacterium]|nr:hypothetical protein [Gemmataceae bacterium]